MLMKETTKQLIRQFVKHYNHFPTHRLVITRWPDDQPTQEEKTDKKCDMIAEQGDLKVAIEHKTIDSLVDQRLDSDKFMRVVGHLEQELKGRFTYRLELSMAVGSVPTGMDWSAIKGNIGKWLLESAPSLPCRLQDHTIAGVPFTVSISKEESDQPGLFVSRVAPAPEDREEQMVEVMKKTIEKADDQLDSYHSARNHTILLLESDDIALANIPAIRLATSKALDAGVPSDNIDEFWLADTSAGESRFHLLFDRGTGPS